MTNVLSSKFIWSIMGLWLVLTIACGSCHSCNKSVGLEDDNLAEQTLEKVIEAETGILIDLTP